mgnify:FL=1|tara:strand:- start:6674 stop:7366 length:693 start_codon:yes stop_codon:yes gene_type:complete
MTNTNTATDTATDTVVSMVSVASIIEDIKSLLEASNDLDNSKASKSAWSGRVAFNVFSALAVGVDISGIKDQVGEAFWKVAKRPISKASTLHNYLHAGNTLIVENEIDGKVIVSIETILSQEVTLSTAHTAMTKARKASEEMATSVTLAAQEEVAAYLRSDNVNEGHMNIPTDTLTQTLGMNGNLQDVRELGRAQMKAENEAFALEQEENIIADHVAFLKARGFKVTAPK